MRILALAFSPRFIVLTACAAADARLRRRGDRRAAALAGVVPRRRRAVRRAFAARPARPRSDLARGAAQLSDLRASALPARGDPAGDAAIFLRERDRRHAVLAQPARRRLPARQDAARQAAVRHAARRLRATATNGCAIRSRRPRSPTSRSASRSAARIARKPYSASVFNISAMSFGALSANAIRALNRGAKLGGFAHDTGEGGFSPYHRESGGDMIWEIGSGYFGCRNRRRRVRSRTTSPRAAANDQIKMIEIKLSQGAKPGHGGVLPAAKVTRGDRRDPRRADGPRLHLAGAPPRLLDAARDDGASSPSCASCPAASRSASSSASAIRGSFSAICKAMLETGIYPGLHRRRRQGGRHRRGAAGIHRPSRHADARGLDLRPQRAGRHRRCASDIRIGASRQDRHRLRHGPRHGARRRLVQLRRAASCSRSAASSRCPATPTAARPASRPRTRRASARWWSPDKTERVRNYHRSMLNALAELTAAAGLEHAQRLPADPFLAPGQRQRDARPSPSFIRSSSRAN